MRNQVTVTAFLVLAASLLFYTAHLFNARFADGLYEEECQFYNGLDGIEARCVRLVTRDQVSGDRVSVSAAILTPSEYNAGTPPILYLPGGWGRPAIPRNDFVLTEQGAFLQRYGAVLESGQQLILVDLRGAGTASPYLSCRSRTEYVLRVGMPELGMRFDRTLYDGLIEECLAGHPHGRDWVKNFTTLRRASDLVNLRRALGIKQWHVYGASHGPRIALVLLKRDRAGIASLLMDSPDYTAGNYFEERQRAFDHRLDLLNIECAEDNLCAGTYPDGIVEAFADLLDQLKIDPFYVASPRDGRQILVSAGNAQAQFYNMLYRPNALRSVMLLMDGLETRDQTHPSLRYVAARSAAVSVSSGYDWLMSWAGICGDYEAGEDVFSRYGLEVTSASNVAWHHETCTQLGIEKEYDLIPASNPAGVPTLVVSGKYDVITPPYYGASLAADLGARAHITHLELAHGVIFGRDACMDDIAVRFWNDPEAEIDTSCLTMQEKGPAVEMAGP